ncbi:unnamed protein product [Polarella glacialis]|uniref:SOUL heme-binding protein n=1 Tax=Polarella glacialis TaxID=89957 RepID=A0A813K3A4_POLGL|nr:unnamed protein product [Polarella glacialis]
MARWSSARQQKLQHVRSSALKHLVLAAALAVVAPLAREAAFAAGLRSPPERRQASVVCAALTWQQRLDKALLSVDATPRGRIKNLRKVLEDPATVLQDVGRAVGIIAEKGFQDGQAEAIDTLWPTGTIARADLEGLQALQKQFPEVLEDLRNLKPGPAPGSQSSATQSSPKEATQSTVSLEKLAAGLLELAADPKKQKELVEEAKNIFRSKPRGLETPSYTVVRTLSGGGPTDTSYSGPGSDVIELRRYEPFTVVRSSMPGGNGSGFSSGEGFQTLAGYLFGKNSDSTAMAMTSPVEISYDGGRDAVMSFVLPKAFAESPPSPQTPDIKLAQVPERLVLVKAFPGVVTQGEVERQRTLLTKVLAADGDRLQPVDASQYSVFQYNPPYTLPWRRLNELAVVVTEVAEALTEVAEALDATTGAPSTSADRPDTAESASETAERLYRR